MKSHHDRDCQWCYDPGNHSDGVSNSGEGPRRNQWKTKRKVSVPCWGPTLEPPPHTSTERTATLSDGDGERIQAEFQNLCKSMQVLWLKASWMTEKYFYMMTRIHAGEARGSPCGPEALLWAATFLGCDRCLSLDCDANSQTNYKGEWIVNIPKVVFQT